MKDNIIYVLKIAMLTFIISIATDRLLYYGLNFISDKVYSGQSIGKLNQFLESKDSLSTVFLGSSRTSRHFDAKKIASNSFNMGMDGVKLAYSTALLQTLPLQTKQNVIFQIDPGYAIDSTYDGSDIKALGTKYLRNDIITDNINSLDQGNAFQRLYRTVGYNNLILGVVNNYLKGDREYINAAGYEPNQIDSLQQKNLRIEIARDNNLIEDCGQQMDITPIYKKLILEIKKFCEENNKNLIFITTPRFKDECKDDNDALSRFMTKSKLRYIDDTDYFQRSNNNEYWKDLGHMSSLGAEQYTPRVKNLVNSLNK